MKLKIQHETHPVLQFVFDGCRSEQNQIVFYQISSIRQFLFTVLHRSRRSMICVFPLLIKSVLKIKTKRDKKKKSTALIV